MGKHNRAVKEYETAAQIVLDEEAVAVGDGIDAIVLQRHVAQRVVGEDKAVIIVLSYYKC